MPYRIRFLWVIKKLWRSARSIGNFDLDSITLRSQVNRKMAKSNSYLSSTSSCSTIEIRCKSQAFTPWVMAWVLISQFETNSLDVPIRDYWRT